MDVVYGRVLSRKSENCQEKITKLFYGGKPESDLPFMWKLKQEVDQTGDYALQQEGNEVLNLAFDDRRNPKYLRLSYFLADLENQLLQNILQEIEN